MMWISWFLLGFVQIGSARWFARHWKTANNVHWLAGIVVTLFTAIDGCIKLILGPWNMNHPHNIAGLIMTITVFFLGFSGQATFAVR